MTMTKEHVKFIVNGKPYKVKIEPYMTLVQFLRDKLGLTGTKHCCGSGLCGTCTVLLEGKPVLSCQTLAVTVKEKSITTIEGLAKGSSLHPIQQAFIDCGAVQCGFCTPGMVLTVKALLDEKLNPTREEVKEAISGNLCRCTGYVKIIDAALSAAKEMRQEEGNRRQEALVVKKRFPRCDAVAKVTGSTIYASDIKLPGMLIGKVLRSPYPHARVLKIDSSKAQSLPGVEAVITVEDAIVTPTTFDFGLLEFPKHVFQRPHQYIFNDKVRYVGEPVAAVAAVSESIAETALELINVKYETQAAVFDAKEAMKPDAPLVHRRNVAARVPYRYAEGDVEKGFREADVVVEDMFRTSRQAHCALETETVIASIDASGKLTVWSPAQAPHIGRRELAHIFNMPPGMVRLVTPFVGGSFGGKIRIAAEPICVALAKKARKPVKLQYTKEEDFIAMYSRSAFEYSAKLGFKKDGTLTAMQMKIIVDAGAYASDAFPPAEIFMNNGMGHYRCPNRAAEAEIVYTNTVMTGPMRGMGNPEAMWGIDQLMDVAAEKLGTDPLELRLRNIKKAGELTMGLPIQSTALDECIRIGAERIGWREKRASKQGGLRRRAVGMATMSLPSGGHPAVLEYSNAFIRLNDDGSAALTVHPVEMGTGILGVLAQIAAEELGLYVQDVHLVRGDTDVTMFDVGSYASRSVYIIGNAVLMAAREAKRKLLQRGAKLLGASADELEVKDRRVYVKANPEKGMSIAQVVYDATYNYRGDCQTISGKCSFVPTTFSPTTQASFAEVEVNTETGKVLPIRIVVVCDCGRAINPANVEGQIEGGVGQAIGFTLTENYAFDKHTGVPVNKDFESYKILSSLDLPDIEVILVEKPDPAGPFGAKGVGEAGFIGIAPAIANAIYNAVGVRIKDLPISPEKILNALENRS
jgi:xanthine dehydrogenase molybdenum-binding subunit